MSREWDPSGTGGPRHGMGTGPQWHRRPHTSWGCDPVAQGDPSMDRTPMAQGDTGKAEGWDAALDRNGTPTAQGGTDVTWGQASNGTVNPLMAQGQDPVTQGTPHVTGTGPQWHRGTWAWDRDRTQCHWGPHASRGRDPSGTGDPARPSAPHPGPRWHTGTPAQRWAWPHVTPRPNRPAPTRVRVPPCPRQPT